MSGRGGARRRAVLVAVGAIVLTGGVGGMVTASAAPDRGSERARVEALAASLAKHQPHQEVRVAAADARDDVANLPRSTDAGLTAGVGLATTLRDTRAKVTVDIPSVTTAVYALPTYRTPPGGFVRAARKYLPERPNPSCDYYFSAFTNDLYVIDVDQPDPTKPGRIRSVGEFPDVKVAMLGFGGLPVTATLHTTQARRNGKIIPLTADFAETPKSVRKGAGSGGDPGCDPAWEAGVSHATVSQGQAVGRFSDVRVDGVPVDVGDHCQTATPLQLNLIGANADNGGNYDLIGGGTLVQQKNPRFVNPANPIATAPGSTNLTIPPFAGCVGRSGEDVSKLVTGLVAGMDATLAVNQSGVAFNSFDPIDNPTVAGVTVPPHVNSYPAGR